MEIHLINCVDRVRPNLAIVSLAPAEGIRAAGVPLIDERRGAELRPRAGPQRLGRAGRGRARPAGGHAGGNSAGQDGQRAVPGAFSNAGPHEITARLEADAVAADNDRYCAIDVPADVPVLLIDGDARARDARYLSIALAPGESVRTGLRPQIETPRYLSVKPLGDYRGHQPGEHRTAGVVGRRRRWRSTWPAGGGVAFFLGERCDVKFFNDVLYRTARGCFPCRWTRQAELVVDRLEPAPDLAGGRALHFPTVHRQTEQLSCRRWRCSGISRCPRDGVRRPTRRVRVAAHLRNGAPLVDRAQLRQGPRHGLLDHGGADVEQLGRQPRASWW